MDELQSPDSPEPSRPGRRTPIQRRTAIACRRCHTRKVKCSASDGIPCSSCLDAGAECELIQSRRGKYVRRKTQQRLEKQGQDQEPYSRGRKALSASEATSDSPEYVCINVHSDAPGARTPVSPPKDTNAPALDADVCDSPGSLYARIAERGVELNQPTITNTSQTAFLGESFSLTYVVNHVLAPCLSDASHFPMRLHFPVNQPNGGRNRPRSEVIRQQYEHLREHSSLYLPPQAVLGRLLTCFFDSFHPGFPILDRELFLQDVASGEASLLVLSSVLMIAVTICTEDSLHLPDGASRHNARSVYYRQAKSLYDADQEPDKFQTIASVFYMSFWWGGPDEQKDSWHWLGIASSLASSLGMNRSYVSFPRDIICRPVLGRSMNSDTKPPFIS